MTGKLVHLVLFGLGILSACSSTQESGENGVSSTEDLHRFEAEFDPTQYNPKVEEVVKLIVPDKNAAVDNPIETSNPPPSEFVQGFRVQIHASSSIDQTSRQKERAEELFPEEWFYMVYDPPTYKLRAGNFLTRFEADRFLRELKEGGFRDSWIVPERVVRNPGPRSVPRQEEPQE